MMIGVTLEQRVTSGPRASICPCWRSAQSLREDCEELERLPGRALHVPDRRPVESSDLMGGPGEASTDARPARS